MKNTVRVTAVVLALALLLVLCGCGKHELSGTWTSVTASEQTTMVFGNSGSVTLTQGGFTISGTYTAKSNQLIMNLTDPQGEMYQISATYYISDKKLYLTNADGSTEVFSR